MIYTFEALQAEKGDCLIFHYGSKSDPKIIVIDGGPGNVYRNSLKPRLLEIRDALAPDGSLPLAMVMVSHMDDDHVNGILDLVDDRQDSLDANETPDFDVQHMWFNTFDDIVGNLQFPVVSGLPQTATVADLVAAVPQYATLSHHLSAVIASTGQGRRLRDAAESQTIPVNRPFTPMGSGDVSLVRSDVLQGAIDWGNGLSIHVLHPDQERLLEMQKKWDEDLKAAKEKGDDSIVLASVSKKDTSPFNLASIVCLVEFDGKRILLTGDARDDDILEGLRRANLLDANDGIHIDILKIPHHGSERNMSREFFEHVTADHYVISGNGEHRNPDKSMLVMLSEGTRGRDDFDLHFTNHEGELGLKEKLDEFIQDEKNHGRTYGIKFREDAAHSLAIDLLEKIDY